MSNDLSKNIGKRITLLRTEQNLSMRKLENLTGFSLSRLSNWEHGKRSPGPTEAIKLAKFLKASAAYILCLTDEKSPDIKPPMIPILTFQEAKNYKTIFKNADNSTLELHKQYDFLPVTKKLFDQISEYSFAITLDDQSMATQFQVNDIIIVDPDIRPNPGSCIVATSKKDECAIFRKYIERTMDNAGNVTFELVPLNKDWATISVNDTKQWQMIGTMVEHRRQFIISS